MVAIRQPAGLPPQGVAFPDGNNGGFWNTMYQTPFATCYIYTINVNGAGTTPGSVAATPISAQLLGGIQSWRPTENAATQDLYQTGTDWIEFIMQPRVWTVSLTRAIPRGYDIRNIMRRIYGNVQDVDFRQLPVVLQSSYSQSDPSGAHQVENAIWTWAMGTFQTVVGPYWSGPYGALMEDLEFKGRGIAFSDSNGNTYNNLEAYWGTAPAT